MQQVRLRDYYERLEVETQPSPPRVSTTNPKIQRRGSIYMQKDWSWTPSQCPEPMVSDVDLYCTDSEDRWGYKEKVMRSEPDPLGSWTAWKTNLYLGFRSLKESFGRCLGWCGGPEDMEMEPLKSHLSEK